MRSNRISWARRHGSYTNGQDGILSAVCIPSSSIRPCHIGDVTRPDGRGSHRSSHHVVLIPSRIIPSRYLCIVRTRRTRARTTDLLSITSHFRVRLGLGNTNTFPSRMREAMEAGFVVLGHSVPSVPVRFSSSPASRSGSLRLSVNMEIDREIDMGHFQETYRLWRQADIFLGRDLLSHFFVRVTACIPSSSIGPCHIAHRIMLY